MPYLTQEQKTNLETQPMRTPGDLTYKIQQLLKSYWVNSPQRYSTIAEILGSIQGARFDFEQRIVKPYEEKKCLENSDVW